MKRGASGKKDHAGRTPSIKDCDEFDRAFRKWYKDRYGHYDYFKPVRRRGKTKEGERPK